MKNYQARLGLTGNRTCTIPDKVAYNQRAYDGKTFIATTACLVNGIRRERKIRVRLVGSDYGLNTSGTGDMVVRPVRWID